MFTTLRHTYAHIQHCCSHTQIQIHVKTYACIYTSTHTHTYTLMNVSCFLGGNVYSVAVRSFFRVCIQGTPGFPQEGAPGGVGSGTGARLVNFCPSPSQPPLPAKAYEGVLTRASKLSRVQANRWLLMPSVVKTQSSVGWRRTFSAGESFW